MTGSHPDTVDVGEIADLLAWARRLTDAGTDADPVQRAAYLIAKTDLLTRIAGQRTGTLSTKDIQ
jgi:hypothetical protein